MIDLHERISEDLWVPKELIENALISAHVRYRKIRIAKRSGGYRTIVQPSAELKLVLAWLDAEILSRLPISKISTAFCPGASILKNAAMHRTSLYSVRADIKDFFPSICSNDLIRVVLANKEKLPDFVNDREFASLLRQACFDGNDRLPIGYPSSPSIANSVMYDIDNALIHKIQSDDDIFGHARLTRYADDFVFSSDKPGSCFEFIRMFEALLAKESSPKLMINTHKTRFMSRRGGSTLITGLRITQDGLIRVHANYRDHVRLLLKHFAAGNLKSDDVPRLVGHLAFIEHADPRLFTKLSYRYFEEIAKLREPTTSANNR